MSKISLFALLFIISCNQEWSNFEKENFLNRCMQQKPIDINIDDNLYDNFCTCLYKQSNKFNISYQDFLKEDLSESDLDKILKPCINE
tara:strand:- start:96 stop:359 length:264 start_codon:yes stop_codon:yes gene_type:complete